MESDEYDTSKSVSSEDQSKNIQKDELANSNIDTNQVDIIFQMEEEAKVRAAKQIAAMLRRPELLEKVPLLIARTEKKKASIDAMLQSAITKQLEGVRTGLESFKSTHEDIQEVKMNYDDMALNLKHVPDLVGRLHELQEENKKFTELKIAMKNLSQIVKIRETVDKTKQAIEAEQFLLAHELISDMEAAREEVLLELKVRSNERDREMCNEYFQGLDQVLEIFKMEIGYTISKCFDVVKKSPGKLVTAVRIAEREEAYDNQLLSEQKLTGFLPPNRPRGWRKLFLERLNQEIVQKVEGNQLESREENKMWLVRHLEVIRIIMLEDLRTAKKHLVACFPPEQNIFHHCLSLYHEAVTKRILRLIEEGLEGNEFVSLLQWILQVYPSSELLGHDSLDLEPDLIPPLLSEEEVEALVRVYLENMRSNYELWMGNTIRQEAEDWSGAAEPELDVENCFYTSTPVLVNRMVEDNLLVSKTISDALVMKTWRLSQECLLTFGLMYREAVVSFMETGTNSDNFIKYSVAIINNTNKFIAVFKVTNTKWIAQETLSKEAVEGGYEDVFLEIGYKALICLVEHLFKGVQNYFLALHDADWLSKTESETNPVGEICNMFNEKFEIFDKLDKKSYERLLNIVKRRTLVDYLTSVMRRRIALTNEDERKSGEDKIREDEGILNEFFIAMNTRGAETQPENNFDVLGFIANIVGADEEMLTFELMTLISKFREINEEQIISILFLRGVSRSDAKQIAVDILQNQERTDDYAADTRVGIFSEVKVLTGLINVKNIFMDKLQ